MNIAYKSHANSFYSNITHINIVSNLERCYIQANLPYTPDLSASE